MTTMPVTPETAYQYMDSYAIWSADGVSFYGCEHNQEEAESIAKWIRFNRASGALTVVRHNTPDQVRAAKLLRSEVVRYRLREDALREMGVWTTPKRRRSK